MADLRKKFIDILFEDDNDDEETNSNEVSTDVRKSESPIKAKDVLYRKSATSPFVNLTEEPKRQEDSVAEKIPEVYEMSSQISPIFGLIKENKPKVVSVKPEITESQTNKPSDSHLDIITSPIYGYGNKEDAIDNNYEVRNIIDENEDDELHHLFDEEENLNNSYDDMQDNPDEEISLFRLFGDNK